MTPLPKLGPAGLGPIVGDTSDTHANVWFSADDVSKEAACAAVALYEADDQGKEREYVHGSARYVGLGTGAERYAVYTFRKLHADRRYVAMIGIVRGWDGALELWPAPPQGEELLPDDATGKALAARLSEAGDKISKATFRTFPTTARKLSFIFGSCHHPGLINDRQLSEAAMGGVLSCFRFPAEGTDPRFLLLVGDQIYADPFPLAPPEKPTAEVFRSHYRLAFGASTMKEIGASPMKEILASVPTYMILDDHEIADNWDPRWHTDGPSKERKRIAMEAYRIYQRSHGPLAGDASNANWYKFEAARFPFFVMDTRTERELVGGQEHMINATQLDALLLWLQQYKDRKGPKFIVSPVTFVPNEIETLGGNAQSSDSWPAFPQTRQKVLEAIVQNHVSNVVFLSGDLHCSMVTRIFFQSNHAASASVHQPDEQKLFAYSITSSAFYVPFLFTKGDRHSYVDDSRVKFGSAGEIDPFNIEIKVNGKAQFMHYKTFDTMYETRDNFLQVDVDMDRDLLDVRCYDRDGKLHRDENGAEKKVTLRLEP